MPREGYERFVRQVGIAGFANVALSLRRFLVLPIFTKQLTPEEFGAWILLASLVDLLAPLAGLRLEVGLARFLPGLQLKKDLGRAVYSVVALTLVSAGIWAGGIFLGWTWLASWLMPRGEGRHLGALVGAAILLSALEIPCRAYFRARRQIRLHAVLAILDAGGFIGLAALLLHIGWGISGIVVALVLSKGGMLVVEWGRMVGEIGRIEIDRGVLREYARFCLPLLPLGIFASLIHQGDRYVISSYWGKEAVGIYSAAYLLGNLCGLVFGPMYQILGPATAELWEAGRREEVRGYLTYVLKYCWVIAIPLIAVVSVLSRPLMLLLAEKSYAVEPLVVGLISCGVVVFMTSGIFQQGIHLMKRTERIALIFGGCALLNLGTNLLVVPQWGIEGAACTTLGTHLCQIGWAYWLIRRELPVAVDWTALTKVVLASGAVGLLLFLLRPGSFLGMMAATGAAGGLYLGLVFALKILSPNERLFWKRIGLMKAGSANVE